MKNKETLALKTCLFMDSLYSSVFPEHYANINYISHSDYSQHQFRDTKHFYNSAKRYVSPLRGKILDFGCAQGGKSVFYATQSKEAEITGIDIDKETLKVAPGFAKKMKTKNVRFKHYDGKRLPFLNNSFDYIFSTAVFEYVDDVSATLDELYRVLKKRGRFCLTGSTLFYSPWGSHVYNYVKFPWCQLLFSRKTLIQAINKSKREGKLYNKQGAVTVLKSLNKITAKKFKKHAKEAGFKIIEFRKSEYIPKKGGIVRAVIKILSHVPIISKYFTFNFFAVLEK